MYAFQNVPKLEFLVCKYTYDLATMILTVISTDIGTLLRAYL
jgi:hypothetical protein